MFLDEKLFQFAIKFPKEQEYSYLLINKLYGLCNDNWLPDVKIGGSKRVVLNKLNQTIKYWDLFIERIKSHSPYLYARINDYKSYGEFIKNTDMFKIIKQ